MRSLDEKTAKKNWPRIKAPFCRPPQARCSARPRSTPHLPRAWQLGRCGGTGEIPSSQTTIPGLPQCASSAGTCDIRRILGTVWTRYFMPAISCLGWPRFGRFQPVGLLWPGEPGMTQADRIEYRWGSDSGLRVMLAGAGGTAGL